MEKIKSLKRKLIISLIIFIVFLFTTIFLYIKVNNSDVTDYEKVNCVVSNIERYTVKRQIKYKTYCMYNSKEYELKNIKGNGSKYSEGNSIEVYLYNQKLYDNYDGIKTSTPLAVLYFIFLFSTFIIIILPITFLVIYNKEKKNSNYL